jgi:hypothetical protein
MATTARSPRASAIGRAIRSAVQFTESRPAVPPLTSDTSTGGGAPGVPHLSTPLPQRRTYTSRSGRSEELRNDTRCLPVQREPSALPRSVTS